jgi:hypothetical protein
MVLVALGWFAVTAVVLGEVPLLGKASLQKAPEIVVGKVMKIYERDPAASGFRRVDFVAELQVVDVEKGDEVKAGDVVYVHYWNQLGKWPPGVVGSRGHDSQSLKEDAKVRVHLRLDKQGRREILLPNGAEAIEE